MKCRINQINEYRGEPQILQPIRIETGKGLIDRVWEAASGLGLGRFFPTESTPLSLSTVISDCNFMGKLLGQDAPKKLREYSLPHGETIFLYQQLPMDVQRNPNEFLFQNRAQGEYAITNLKGVRGEDRDNEAAKQIVLLLRKMGLADCEITTLSQVCQQGLAKPAMEQVVAKYSGYALGKGEGPVPGQARERHFLFKINRDVGAIEVALQAIFCLVPLSDPDDPNKRYVMTKTVVDLTSGEGTVTISPVSSTPSSFDIS